jgi:hypothetical protein
MQNHRSISLKTAVPAVLIALIASLTIAAAGQDVVVKVPFDFQAGKTHFAPGAYVLTMDTVSTGSIMIRSADDSRRAILLARKSSSPGYGTHPTVSFRSYGDSRFLTVVQSEGAGRWDLVPSSEEITLAHLAGQPQVASLLADTGK